MKILRIYDTVRTAHLERLSELRPSTLVYRSASYDFDEGSAPRVRAIRAGRFRTLVKIARARPEIIELNEPAQLNAWPSTLLYVALIRSLNGLRLTRTRIVYYAIENDDVLARFKSYRGLRNPLAFGVLRALYTYLTNSAARIAFGTAAAMHQYRQNCPRMTAEVALFPALPAARTVTAPKESVAAFVGSFEARKGIVQLMEAWQSCSGPGRALVIAGKGPLEGEIARRAALRTDVDLHVGPTRDFIWKVLERATVLVLFSQPERRWREQVGLPIVEGLSFGCEIVASTESGLAEWLRENGHRVLPPDASKESLAEAIDAALSTERSLEDLLARLPAVDGRVEADAWLTG